MGLVMTRKEIESNLKKPYNNTLVAQTWILLFNHYKDFKKNLRDFVTFANSRLKAKDYDSILFVQYVYNGVCNVVKTLKFQMAYFTVFYDLFEFDSSSMYKLSYDIVNYLEDKFFKG